MPPPLGQRLGPPKIAELPADHLGLSWRKVELADGPGLWKMVLKSELADEVHRYTDSDRVAQILGANLGADYVQTLVGTDRRGRIQAVATVVLDPDEKEVARAELFALTNKKWRGRGIGRALLSWQLAKARQMLVKAYGEDSTIPASISNVVEGRDIDRRRLYMAAGFSRRAQLKIWHHDLGNIPRAKFDSNYRIVPFSTDLISQIHRLHREDLGDGATTSNQRQKWWITALRKVNPKLSFSVLDTDNRVVGHILTSSSAASTLGGGEVNNVVELMNVDSSHHHRGIEQALIAQVLQAAAPHGGRVSIEVNSGGYTSLMQALEDMGFSEAGSRLIYAIEV